MKYLLILCTALLTLSCQAQWGKSVRGSGNMKTENRQLGDYESIDVAGNLNVILVKGREGDITVLADDNLHEYIITEIKGDALNIKVEDGYNLKNSKGNKLVIKVPIQSVEEVHLAGSGDVNSETLIEAESFSTAIAGSGNMSLEVMAKRVKGSVAGSGMLNLTGQSEQLKLSIAGSGDIMANDFKASDVKASISGSGDIDFYCESCSLKAAISGSGDIQYEGDPANVEESVVGSGSVRRK